MQYLGCTGSIEEMDHVEGLAALGIPRTPVLSANDIQGVCRHCHAIKTDGQRRDGIARAKARRGGHVSRKYRDVERHPGQL